MIKNKDVDWLIEPSEDTTGVQNISKTGSQEIILLVENGADILFSSSYSR